MMSSTDIVKSFLASYCRSEPYGSMKYHRNASIYVTQSEQQEYNLLTHHIENTKKCLFLHSLTQYSVLIFFNLHTFVFFFLFL